MSPTIVLVHGAFAESASWDGVAEPLQSADYDVVAAANPLRGLAADAAVDQRRGPLDRGARRSSSPTPTAAPS